MIGAIAVGFGVIGFIAANWDGISHGLRLALLTVAIVAARTPAAYHFRERTRSQPARRSGALSPGRPPLRRRALFSSGRCTTSRRTTRSPSCSGRAAAAAVALVVALAFALTPRPPLLIFSGLDRIRGRARRSTTPATTFSTLPVVAVLYGGALYGLAHGARKSGSARPVRGAAAFRSPPERRPPPSRLPGCSSSRSPRWRTNSLRARTGWTASCSRGSCSWRRSPSQERAHSRSPTRRSGRYAKGALAAVLVTMLVAMTAGGSGGSVYALVFNLLFAAVALGVIYAW